MTTIDWYFYFVALKGHLESKLDESEAAKCRAPHGYLGDMIDDVDLCLSRLSHEIEWERQSEEAA